MSETADVAVLDGAASSDGRWVVDPRPRAQRLRTPLTLAGVAALGVGYLLLFDPNAPGHFPLCPFKSATGLDCPACGGLRCTRALLSGDLVTAWDRNALAVIVLPLVVLAWVLSLRRAWTGRSPSPTPRRLRTTRVLWTVSLVLLGLWTVWRNLPEGQFFFSDLSH